MVREGTICKTKKAGIVAYVNSPTGKKRFAKSKSDVILRAYSLFFENDKFWVEVNLFGKPAYILCDDLEFIVQSEVDAAIEKFREQELNKILYSAKNSPGGAGSQFDSMEDAAKDFAIKENKRSIENNWEYATYIYSYKVNVPAFLFFGTKTIDKFSYTAPHTNKDASNVDVEPGKFVKPRADAKLVALAHTHSAWNSLRVVGGKDYNDVFSPADLTIAKKYRSYLASPNGSLQCRTTHMTTVLFNAWNDKVAHDKNHPDLPRNHKENCKNCY